ncbi:MAG TPA: hypothetical protein EYO84_09090, partial [Planctomycetes bacterium]|nr:hypothetical protein [Planctomycetota bacterium]
FGTDGIQLLSLTSGVDFIHEINYLPDGTILAVGAVNEHFGLIRFNSDLSLDASFGTGGVVESDFGAGQHAHTWTMHPDGTLLVAGGSQLAKYNLDGTLDTSFGTDGHVSNGHTNSILSVAVQPDGKILAAGHSNTDFRVSRYYPDGTLDQNFSFNAGSRGGEDRATGVYPLEDGDFLLVGGGDVNYYNSDNHRFSAKRISVSGSTETNFNHDFGNNHKVNRSLELPDGKILMVGRLDGDFLISRIHRDGSLDTSFGDSGKTRIPVLNGDDYAQGVSLQPDGKILLVGKSHNGSNWDLSIARLSYDGQLDTALDGDGKLSISLSGNEDGYAVLSMTDGTILIAGRTGNDIALVRLLGDSNQDGLA